MPYICKECGSLSWREVFEGVADYTINSYGYAEELGIDYGETKEILCAECFSDSLIGFKDVSPEIAQRLLSIKDGKERLKTFLFLVLEGKIKANISKEKAINYLKENFNIKEDEILARII